MELRTQLAAPANYRCARDPLSVGAPAGARVLRRWTSTMTSETVNGHSCQSASQRRLARLSPTEWSGGMLV